MIYVVTKQQMLFKDSRYTIISIDESLSMLNKCSVLQYDSETGGKDARIANILCIQFGNKKENFKIVVDTTTIPILYYKHILETIPIIGHNLKFDIQFLYTAGIIPTKVYDTMIVEQLLYLGYPPNGKYGGIGFSLNAVANRYLGIDIDKSIRGDIIWRGLDSDVIIYAAGDVTYLEDILELQWKQCIKKTCTKAAILENNFVPVIAYLEWCGIKLDIKAWKNKMEKDISNLEKAKKSLDELAVSWGNPEYFIIDNQGDLFLGFDLEPKCTVNWSSSQQVVKVAKYLGFNTLIQDKKTGDDKDSVVEKHLASQKGINDEFLKAYFQYQEASKLCSTYGQTYIDAINPITGRIHTVFRQLGASSGRMTCGDGRNNNTDLARFKKINPKLCKYVQLQTLPSDHDTRASFIAEEDNLFCSADYSGLEARLGADIYNEQSMIDEFLTGGGDIHSLVARACYPEISHLSTQEIKKNYPDKRKAAKPVGFAKQFGGSAFAIAGSLNCTIEQAQKIADQYDNYFTGITGFAKEGLKKLKDTGYIVICQYTGHKIYWWDYDTWKKRQESFTSEFWEEYRKLKALDINHPTVVEVKNHFKAVSKWQRLVLNSPTQGRGIIILKQAMVDFFRYIIENNLFNKVKIVALVHDEANIEFPKNLPEIPNILKQCMENAADIYCKKLPIPADISVGSYWIH